MSRDLEHDVPLKHQAFWITCTTLDLTKCTEWRLKSFYCLGRKMVFSQSKKTWR